MKIKNYLIAILIVICLGLAFYINWLQGPERCRRQIVALDIDYSKTQFLIAVSRGDHVVVNYFLKSGMTADVKNKNGWSKSSLKVDLLV